MWDYWCRCASFFVKVLEKWIMPKRSKSIGVNKVKLAGNAYF